MFADSPPIRLAITSYATSGLAKILASQTFSNFIILASQTSQIHQNVGPPAPWTPNLTLRIDFLWNLGICPKSPDFTLWLHKLFFSSTQAVFF